MPWVLHPVAALLITWFLSIEDRALRTISLLKRPADKDDCADMVVTMCRTETMTGQTIAIDSGRYFH